ncbi:MAG: CopG family transcriptional regulator [Legionellaceae bacterium]|nr:CopG family transcriptional regulator [Legionellaceae bacterium]
MSTSKAKKVKTSEFDKLFDEGEVNEFLDLKSVKARYPTQRISIDFPKNILEEVDIAAAKVGVTRTSLIKMWVAAQLSHQHPHDMSRSR